VLEFQLQLAKEADLPIIFHVREAFDDFWPIYDNTPVRGVLHSFTDSKANLDKALQRGLFIGVNGIATFAKSKEQINMYKSIPPEHLLLETDAPFLTPTPNRGKINEPKQIVRICEFLAELRGEKHNQLAAQTSKNAAQLFDI
jgi:TatD DNase family protein